MKLEKAVVFCVVAGAVFVLAMFLFQGGCALHNPVPVDPNYPPEPPFAAADASLG